MRPKGEWLPDIRLSTPNTVYGIIRWHEKIILVVHAYSLEYMGPEDIGTIIIFIPQLFLNIKGHPYDTRMLFEALQLASIATVLHRNITVGSAFGMISWK